MVLMTMMTIRHPPRRAAEKLFGRPLSPPMDMRLEARANGPGPASEGKTKYLKSVPGGI